MAIYYIDPHTTTNGTGTWASPWSLNTTTRTGLASGDEIRIKGVALSSLLTATEYTATVTNNYQLTITAGGGLGADWVAGDVGYFPAYDTFFKVYSVATNIVQVYTSTSMLPIKNWTAGSVTVRKVNTTTYPVSVAGAAYNIGPTSLLNNITVSDCWTDATTRVTDGTVKTLFNNSQTSAMAFYSDVVASGSITGWTVNLQNTHVMCPRGTSSGYVSTYMNGSNSTYSINQIYSWGSSGSGIIQSSGLTNTTLNITHFANYYGLGASCFGGQNNTINITNLLVYSADIFGSGGGVLVPNNTVNITNYSLNVLIVNSLFGNINGAYSTTVNLTGTIDQYGASPATYFVWGYGDTTFNIGSEVIYYYSRRVSTKSSWVSYVYYVNASAYGPTTYFPTINISNGWTYTSSIYNTTTIVPLNNSSSGTPEIFKIVYPVNNITPYYPSGYTYNNNVLVTFKDGSAPFEILSAFGTNYFTSTTNQNLPKVTTDATVYRTTGPSLKSYLESRVTTIWVSTQAKATKTIKIPCTSGTSYTVSGYIRTDDTAYTNDDCRMGIFLNGVEVTGQNMTTSCINAWEQFTLTFTASTTGEYVLGWKMYYANGAKSYWLDDLVIS